jgi:2,4-dienoyl-CoA reductase-like NADH-dependent reductase (Old Yellow Enzyme family)
MMVSIHRSQPKLIGPILRPSRRVPRPLPIGLETASKPKPMIRDQGRARDSKGIAKIRNEFLDCVRIIICQRRTKGQYILEAGFDGVELHAAHIIWLSDRSILEPRGQQTNGRQRRFGPKSNNVAYYETSWMRFVTSGMLRT